MSEPTIITLRHRYGGLVQVSLTPGHVNPPHYWVYLGPYAAGRCIGCVTDLGEQGDVSYLPADHPFRMRWTATSLDGHFRFTAKQRDETLQELAEYVAWQALVAKTNPTQTEDKS